VKKRLTRIAPLKLGLALALGLLAFGLVFTLVIWGVDGWEMRSGDYSYHEIPWRGEPPASPVVPPAPPQAGTGQHVDFAGGTVVHLGYPTMGQAQNDFTFSVIEGYAFLFLPFVYALVGFVGGFVGAWIFNLTAKWTGGIVINVEDIT
jgi:hypothetical protein